MKEKVDLEEFNRQRIEIGKEKGRYSEIVIFFRRRRKFPINKISF